jgi:hypothetical protein
MTTKLKRVGQLGLLAKEMASARFHRTCSGRERAVREVVSRLGLMHGLPQKIGQILSFSDLEERSASFAPLTEGEATMSASEAFAVVECQMERSLGECFEWIDPSGISASIGQVHRAVLRDGREVAVKVQYPGIAEAVEMDLNLLGWLSAPVGDLRRGFDMGAYRREIGSMLESELDYHAEARMIRQYRKWTGGWRHLVLPEVIDDCSGDRVLTMTWVAGEKIAAAATWPEGDRRILAETMLRLFLRGTFVWGHLHADPHPGNYRFLRGDGGPRLGLLDFGCVKRLDPAFQSGLRGLIEDCRRRRLDNDQAWRRFIGMGFNETMLAPLKPKLARLAKILTEPFTERRDFDTRCWNLPARIAECLGPDRMAFRLSGPSTMLFFLRAFQGLVRYLDALAVPAPWASLLDEIAPAPAQAPAPTVPTETDETPFMKSEALHISVLEDGETRVSLCFGAAATDNLSDLVPLDLRSRLTERSINLTAIAAEARRNAYAPGELFKFEEGKKSVRVWLE